jgi:hypothetical protein
VGPGKREARNIARLFGRMDWPRRRLGGLGSSMIVRESAYGLMLKKRSLSAGT